MIKIPESNLEYLPQVSGYKGTTCLNSWGMQTTTNDLYLDQQWGSLNSPYCDEADAFLYTAAVHLMQTGSRKSSANILEVTPD